ncbi:UNVERIFIED_ORG: SNF2 family DNA or RNA helicase [Rhizobium esperanzae]
MLKAIQVATGDIARFLEDRMPRISEAWWERHVIDRLSFQQQRVVKELGHTSLRQLDFAALLRVLDQNWYELSNSCNLPREARNWIKELQTARNKWAHLSAEEMPPSEIYRDADTLGRLLQLIDASAASIEIVAGAKERALASMTSNATASSGSAAPAKTAQLFQVGQLVSLRSEPQAQLPVLEVVPGGAESRYRVFQGNAKVTYYESQLQAAPDAADDERLISANEFHARMTASHLLSPSTTNLFSLRSGRVNFVPYQYRPVLKLIRAERPRLLIADEVGVGKTIEAGFIIKELRARMDISSVLVICPKALVAERKWFTEMKRFDEQFTALDGPMLRHCLHEVDLEGEWPEQYAKAILPFSLFDSELVFGRVGRRVKDKGLLALDPAPAFDLVIVDEAHHLRNSETFLHQGVRYFCDNARAVVLMTATPVQLGSDDLFTLLNIIRPDLVIDHASFEQMAAPNPFLNEAIRHCRAATADWRQAALDCLRSAIETEWGRLFLREAPAVQKVFDKLHEEGLTDAERVGLTRSLEELYTFSPIINRTRRRDIGEFTTRKPQTVSIAFSAEQQALHDQLLDIVARILARCHGQQNVKFMMTTIRRQAASCLYGLAPLLSDILHRNLDRLEIMEATDSDSDTDLAFVDQVRSEIQELLSRSELLDPHDEKVSAFIQMLREKGQLENNKALVFSTFRHTLAYLAKHANSAGLRYGLIHGDVKDEERAELRRRFVLPKGDTDALDVLLSSEVGCEGLDFQFCNFLINYDLPWNPMKVEQRIGRIDRYGQKSATISIVNFITPGTVDADIYQRCLWRIGVFQHAVGGSEEILGQVTQELHDIAESFQLTEEERATRLQQLADNGIRRIREEQELEEKQSELFGLNVPRQSWRDDIAAAETEWLSPDSIQRCVVAYLDELLCRKVDHFLGEKHLKTLRLDQEARNLLLSDFLRLPRSIDPLARGWEKWLKGSQPTLSVTFDQETAVANPKAVHLSLLHPLVRQAARFFEITETARCALAVTAERLPAGVYNFALYRWSKRGIRSDEILMAVADDPVVEKNLLDLLQSTTACGEVTSPTREQEDALDAHHHIKWAEAQANHIAANRELAEHRIQSLTVSHRARVRVIEDQLAQANNDKIRLMKHGELSRAEADFNRRIEELQALAGSGDVRAQPLLFGKLRILGGRHG